MPEKSIHGIETHFDVLYQKRPAHSVISAFNRSVFYLPHRRLIKCCFAERVMVFLKFGNLFSVFLLQV